jgi:hypothetical protein
MSCLKSVIGHPEFLKRLDSGLRTAGMTDREAGFIEKPACSGILNHKEVKI